MSARFRRSRRDFLYSIGGLAAAGLFSQASAQELPAGAGRLVVPFPPGGPTDILARLMTAGYKTRLNINFIVENKPGATGNIGAFEVTRAKPDGLTLLLTNTSIVSNPHLFKNTKFVDPFKELTPVASLATIPLALIIPGAAPEKTFQEWADRVKRTGKATYGSFGIGAINHLLGHQLATKLDLPLEHIPYKGNAPAVADLMSGTIDCGFFNVANMAEFIKAGRFKALALASRDRSRILPDVPTFAQLGHPEIVTDGWLGIFAPAGTPVPALEKLALVSTEIMRTPEAQAQLDALGFDARLAGPKDFAVMVQSESTLLGERLKAAGVSPE